ncbi:MAG: accessory gene regulator B family protein [Eubacteriales bacterium]|nr:accessory gene regulator B family protein [Eubacteriales bacterium]
MKVCYHTCIANEVRNNMLERLAKRISLWCCKVLDEENGQKAEVLQYGLEVFLDGVIKIIIILGLGAVLGKFLEFAIYLLGLCSLRIWAGGYHFGTRLRCLLAMLGMGFASVYGAQFFAGSSFLWPGVIFIVECLVLYAGAPGQMPGKEIRDGETIRRKRLGAFVWLLLEYIAVLLLPGENLKWVLIISILFEICSIIPCMSGKKERRKCHEQRN